ncbi:hypothetical protein TNCT_211621 [Trichonephila clavata]|uniref:Uncharacterized protein n=1 Tax=Trichonephila clavata TaxID=2740835 RepID=A0A8X6HP29_TRICU|nr:hypothetical protein TNCT_211621 [Trichonephila clavata]
MRTTLVCILQLNNRSHQQIWMGYCHTPTTHSIDLVPSDYHLISKLKKHLGGMFFRTGEELKEEFLSYRRGGRVIRFRYKADDTSHAKMH